MREMGGWEKRRGWNGEEARVGGRKGEGEEEREGRRAVRRRERRRDMED